MTGFTAAFSYIAGKMHSAGRKLSLTSYFSNYQSAYNTYALAPILYYLNVQDYTETLSTFESEIQSMMSGMPSGSLNRLQVGFGDYGGQNAPIAGECMQFCLENNIRSVAVWPAYGTELSLGGYGYVDNVYNTTSYYGLLEYFLTH